MFRLSLVILGFLISSTTFAQNNNAIEDKLNAALASEIRTTAEKARDRNRKPLETLNFFQLKDDMRVLELVAGGGWYTKLLAPILKENGEYYVAVWADNLKKGLLSQKGFEHVKTVDGINPSRSGVGRLNTIEPFSLGLTNLDLVVTFRNMHNFDVAGRNAINQATYDALKSGGLYGVIDHTRRHMQPMTNEVWRRADPMQITKELLDIGFELAAYSDLHYRPDDELRYEVGRKSVTGNTDRFTMLFRKP
ncbi:MAG: putative methyltransferase [Woeseiaceae bacterium]|jgi:predicted methyltransferase|tara:strand:+ start:26809 stop:27558 length:750 start_codon:yes stop_codon:yes gene_type:complete